MTGNRIAPAPPAVGLPRWVGIPAALGMLLVLLPIAALVARVPWPRIGELLASESSLAALRLSVATATASTAVCLILGVPLALVLARSRRRALGAVRLLVLLPLVLPPVVGGLALLYTFGRQGLLGSAFEVLGVQVAFSTLAVVIAQVFVSLPFLVVSLEAGLRATGDEHERAAAVLGAGPTRVLTRVTLPLALPSIAAGAVLCFARALGEFGATITFAGSLQGVTRTLPLEIYLQREVDADAAVALSALLAAVALAVLLATSRSLGRTS